MAMIPPSLRNRRDAMPAIAALVVSAFSAAHALPAVPKFSQLPPGAGLGAPFRILTLPRLAANRFTLERDADVTVLRVASDKSAGSLAVPLTATLESGARLSWRWKIDRALQRADMDSKAGDDFAARVYVFFDLPLDSLPFLERQKIKLARLVSGAEVPAAALCYVWDNRHAAGHSAWSAYTDRVRMIVLRGRHDPLQAWLNESRDVAADFKAAFGRAMPPVTGIALGNDTDNTGESAVAWFGDVEFGR
jgi:hypothetical protein